MNNRSNEGDSNHNNKVVVVTGPHCRQDPTDGTVSIEPVVCDTVDLKDTTMTSSRASASVLQAHESQQEQQQQRRAEQDKPNPSFLVSSSWLEESYFGAKDEIVMQEMQERKRNEPVTHIIPSEQRDVAGFDACREYGYKYAEDNDDNDDDTDDCNDDDEDRRGGHRFDAGVLGQQHNRMMSQEDRGTALLSLDVSTISFANPLEASASSDDLSYKQYLLGKSYHPLHDYTEKRRDENSLFWFTYRIDFPEIKPYAITTDAGWGCMLRSAQMLLGQTMRMHYKDRDWTPPLGIAQKRRDVFVRRILTYFADFPSTDECFFSLHNMVAAGFAKHDILPGEWYGPGTACYVLRDLCQMVEDHEGKSVKKPDRPIFRVYVASQGTVYKEEVNKLMTRDVEARNQAKKKKAAQASDGTSAVPEEAPTVEFTHPLDPQYDVVKEHETVPWDTSLLLMVPLRLGLKNFNEKYSRSLAHTVGAKGSVGILGGRPRGARWFYGATSDGLKLNGLDPHTIQTAPLRREVKRPTTQPGQTNSTAKKSVVAFTESYLRSVQTTTQETIDLKRVDPSLAVGFYCRDREEFDELCRELEDWKKAKENRGLPELFVVADTVPDYSATVSSAMDEMLAMSEGAAESMTKPSTIRGGGDEDDDFVLL